jgi:hypothetical protein
MLVEQVGGEHAKGWIGELRARVPLHDLDSEPVQALSTVDKSKSPALWMSAGSCVAISRRSSRRALPVSLTINPGEARKVGTCARPNRLARTKAEHARASWLHRAADGAGGQDRCRRAKLVHCLSFHPCSAALLASVGLPKESTSLTLIAPKL